MTDDTVYTVIASGDTNAGSSSSSFYEKDGVVTSVSTSTPDDTAYAVADDLQGPGGSPSSSFYEHGTVYTDIVYATTVVDQINASAAAAAASATAAQLALTTFLVSPGFSGIPTAPTAAPGTNTTQIATTAFSTAAVAAEAALRASADTALSTSLTTAYQNADTALSGTLTTAYTNADTTLLGTVNSSLALKAPLASPGFSGVPTAPTATVGTNTTQLATTAFVSSALPVPAAAAPIIDGTAAVGTSAKYAREDHVHPTDTSRAALASPTFTGVPAAPTATAGTNTTQIATTAFVTSAVSAAGVSSVGGVTGAIGLDPGLKMNSSNVALKNGLFEVDRNGTNQTGLTASADNKITWTTANVNNESWFSLATGKYTPLVAGSYVFTLSVNSVTGTGGESCQAELYKNGTKVKVGTYTASNGPNINTVTAVIPMNGTTDYVEAYLYLPAATTTLVGAPSTTHFQGWRAGS